MSHINSLAENLFEVVFCKDGTVGWNNRIISTRMFTHSNLNYIMEHFQFYKMEIRYRSRLSVL